jgi:hypothetical protein
MIRSSSDYQGYKERGPRRIGTELGSIQEKTNLFVQGADDVVNSLAKDGR